MRDNYIPLFDNKPSSYREYRQRLLLYYKKMKIQKKTAEATISLLTSLSGVAWSRVEHLADSASDQEDGFMAVLTELDKAFQYDGRVEMPKALDRYFYSLQRKPEQTLLSFCGEVRESVRELERHGIKLPKEVQGYVMLKRSGLTAEQKQLVLSQVGVKLVPDQIESNLFFLFGQDYKSVARAPANRTWYRGSSKHGSSSATWRRSYGTANVAEDLPWDDDGAFDFRLILSKKSPTFRTTMRRLNMFQAQTSLTAHCTRTTRPHLKTRPWKRLMPRT